MRTGLVMVLAVTLVFLSFAVFAAGPQPGGSPDQPGKKEEPVKQPEKPKIVKQKVVFCPTIAVQSGPFLVDGVNCETRCQEKSKEFTCKIRDYLSKGWKVQASVNKDIMSNDAPCTCKVTGTEYIIELEISPSK